MKESEMKIWWDSNPLDLKFDDLYRFTVRPMQLSRSKFKSQDKKERCILYVNSF
jgi:hypothetical protein